LARPAAFDASPAEASSPRVARLLAWTTRPFGAAVIAVALIATGALLSLVPGMKSADLALLDAKYALLARYAPIAAQEQIAIVGVDEPSLAALDTPLSLMLRPLAEALTAIAATGPRVVGLDVILPDRSYEALAPGATRALVTALIAARRSVPVVVGITSREDGSVRPVVPALLSAAAASGFALLPVDADGRVRRIDDRLGVAGERVPTFVGELARTLGVPFERGAIQYALGDGYDYVPLWRVLEWARTGGTRELDAAFRGRIVLIGAVLPFEDRFAQPVPLARWDRVRDAPGVLVHAQALRTLEAGAIVHEVPLAVQTAMLVLAACLWFVPRWHRRIGALVVFAIVAFAVSTLLLRSGIELPLGASLRVALTAAALKSALEAWQVRQERARLRTQFGGYVSPAVLAAILEGRLDADSRRGRRTLAFLFADIRGFVALSAKAPPEAVLALLNRYFGAMIPVLHANGGTIDNFRGDGVMVMFGAPNALDAPARAAVDAARTMLGRLDALNGELAAEGIEPLSIGISLACSEAVVGNVGSRERFNYTALGDGANVAARLQEVARSSGWPVVASAELVAAAGETAQWTPLGLFAIRGHADVDVLGWRPAA
jgi:class 3 adenylate cyclase/CHASE2 domain-containing sensor protein